MFALSRIHLFFLASISITIIIVYKASETRQIKGNNGSILRRKSDDAHSNEISARVLVTTPSIPPYLEEELADLSEQYRKGRDVPFYWHIPKTGGTTVQDYFGECFGLVEASERGVLENHQADEELQVVEIYGDKYVNVDTTNAPGIARAKALGLAPSGLADVVFSQFLHSGSSMFDREHPGRMFAVFRHPVLRAASLFSYLSVATWEKTYHPDFADMTIEQYASSPMAEENWMTRFLVNKPEGALFQEDVEVAKEILRKKCLIGMLDNMDESISRFTRYFGWVAEGDASQQNECKRKYFYENVHKHNGMKSGTKAWDLLKEKNKKDLQLYHYAEELFAEQERLFIDLDE